MPLHDLLAGTAERFDVFARIPHADFPGQGVTEPERVYQLVKQAAKTGPLDDDFSLMAVTFP